MDSNKLTLPGRQKHLILTLNRRPQSLARLADRPPGLVYRLQRPARRKCELNQQSFMDQEVFEGGCQLVLAARRALEIFALHPHGIKKIGQIGWSTQKEAQRADSQAFGIYDGVGKVLLHSLVPSTSAFMGRCFSLAPSCETLGSRDANRFFHLWARLFRDG